MAGEPARFADMDCISPETLAILEERKFTQATPVQHAVIPLFCSSKDVAVDAATGSGKTLAFVIPIAEKLRKLDAPPKPHEVLALIISPTRELAAQTHRVAGPFLQCIPGCALASLIGGTSVADDIAQVKRGAAVIIGTPGRIADLMTRSEALSYKRFEVLVLDEADRLLEMGFQKQLDAIMARLPRQRRTGLFSATQTDAVAALVRAGLRNPFQINVAVASTAATAPNQKTPSSLEIQYIVVPGDEKITQLIAFLSENRDQKVIAYALTCATVDWLATALPRLPGGGAMPVLALHGNMRQAKRTEVLAEFARLPAACLFCTDVAARGLDIPDVQWVFQLDPPQNPANFVHRCGRTARMGRAGRALVLLHPHEDCYVELLAARNVPMTQRDPYAIAATPVATATAPAHDAHATPASAAAARAGGCAAPAGTDAAEATHSPDMLGCDDRHAAAAALRLAETDRDVLDKAMRAFVSHVRGYKEHQCTFIFQLADLDLNHLARMYGLLRLPVMKEVRKNVKGLRDFKQSSVEPDSVPYLDAAREKARLKQLKRDAAQNGGSDDRGGKSKGGCKAEQKQARAKAAAEEAERLRKAKKMPAAKRQKLQSREDDDDLDDDYRAYRKHKKGKLDDATYKRSIGLVD